MTTITAPPPPTVQPEPRVAPAAPAIRALARQAARYDGPRDIDGQLRLASALAPAKALLAPHFYNSPADVLAGIYEASALDVAVAVALRHLHIESDEAGKPIPGRCGMSGSLMLALLLRAGHRVTVVKADEIEVVMRLERIDGQPDGEAKWELAEAQRAGLTDRVSWRFYPGDMLFWRCVSRLARRYASDVVLGLGYTPEELAEGAPTAVDPELAPPVGVDVQELLADLATLDYDGLRALWTVARKRGLVDEHAGVVDGVAYTVGGLLALKSGEALARAADDAPADEPAPTAAEDEPKLGCGCSTREFIATGQHREGCEERELWGDTELTAAEPTEATNAPGDDEATWVDDDVLGYQLPCGCIEAMVKITKTHRAECHLSAGEDGPQ